MNLRERNNRILIIVALTVVLIISMTAVGFSWYSNSIQKSGLSMQSAQLSASVVAYKNSVDDDNKFYEATVSGSNTNVTVNNNYSFNLDSSNQDEIYIALLNDSVDSLNLDSNIVFYIEDFEEGNPDLSGIGGYSYKIADITGFLSVTDSDESDTIEMSEVLTGLSAYIEDGEDNPSAESASLVSLQDFNVRSSLGGDFNRYAVIRLTLCAPASAVYSGEQFDFGFNTYFVQSGGDVETTGGQNFYVYTSTELEGYLSKGFDSGDSVFIMNDITYDGDIVFEAPVKLYLNENTLTVKGNFVCSYIGSGGTFLIDTSNGGKLRVKEINEIGGDFTMFAPNCVVELKGSGNSAVDKGDIYIDGTFTADASCNTAAKLGDKNVYGLVFNDSYLRDNTDNALKNIVLQNNTELTISTAQTVGNIIADNLDTMNYVRIINHGTVSGIDVSGMDKVDGEISRPQIYIENHNTVNSNITLPSWAKQYSLESSSSNGNTRIEYKEGSNLQNIRIDGLGIIAYNGKAGDFADCDIIIGGRECEYTQVVENNIKYYLAPLEDDPSHSGIEGYEIMYMDISDANISASLSLLSTANSLPVLAINEIVGHNLEETTVQTLVLPQSLRYFSSFSKYLPATFNQFSFSVPENNTSFKIISGVVYSHDKSMLVSYPKGKTGASYEIEKTTVAIADNAFAGNTNIRTVVIPGTVSMADRVFEGCTDLQYLIFLSKKVCHFLGDETFGDFTNSVKGVYVFSDCLEDYKNSILFDSHFRSLVKEFTSVSEETVSEATCQQSGTLRYTLGLQGTDTKTVDLTIAKTNHRFGVWTVTAQPTCITPGTLEHTCSICNETVTDSNRLAPNGHNYSDGFCTVCGALHPDRQYYSSSATPSKYGWKIDGEDTFYLNFARVSSAMTVSFDACFVNAESNVDDYYLIVSNDAGTNKDIELYPVEDTSTGGNVLPPEVVGASPYAYDMLWGSYGIDNWHHIEFRLSNGIENGFVEILVDGTFVGKCDNFTYDSASKLEFYVASDGYFLIDNVSYGSTTIDFEAEASANTLMNNSAGERYKHNVCTLKYDLQNGNVGRVGFVYGMPGQKVPVTSKIPSYNGHTFKGWARSNSSSTADYHGGDMYTMPSSSSVVTVYAVW